MPVFVLGSGGNNGEETDFSVITATISDVKAGKVFIDSNGDTVVGTLSQGDATATSAQILTGYSAYNNFSKIEGSIPIAQQDAEGEWPLARTISIYEGEILMRPQTAYFNNAWCRQSVPNLTAANIKTGVVISGPDGASTHTITGTFTSDATATASQILSGKIAYVKGSKITGTMTNRGNYTNAVSVGSNTTGVMYIRIPLGAYITGGGLGYPEITVNMSTIVQGFVNPGAINYSNGYTTGFTGNVNLRDPNRISTAIGTVNGTGRRIYKSNYTTSYNGSTFRLCFFPVMIATQYMN